MNVEGLTADYTAVPGRLPRGDQNYDPMFKLRPLLTHMKHKFGEYFVPSEHIAIDEAMIAYDGRVYFKQYMPQKPTKWGIKIWEVTDSATGYCLDFDVFGGKERRRSAYGVGYDVIHKLSQRYLNKNYHLYFDRYFTGLPGQQQNTDQKPHTGSFSHRDQ